MKRILLRILLLGLLCLVSSYFTERLIGLQTHTLAAQDNWISLKIGNSLHRRGLMGTGEYVRERQALAGEELNLSAWFGFNDLVYYKALPEFSEYRVHFRLEDPKSFLWIYLDCGPQYCNAIRVSRTKFYPSGLFRVAYDGRFLERTPLPLLERGPFDFILKKEGPGFVVSIGDDIKIPIAYDLPEKSIRLLGSPDGAVVSFIQVDEKKIDFQVPFNTKRFLVALAVFALLSTVIAAFSVFAGLLNVLVLLALVLILFFFDRSYWSHLYLGDEKFRRDMFGPTADVSFARPVPLAHFEAIRQWAAPDLSLAGFPQLLASNGAVQFKKDISDAAERKMDRTVMIAFLGGSQAWGAGATSGNLTWPSLVIQKLQLQTQKSVRGVNFAVCGATLEAYFKWLPQIKQLKPDLMLVHLGVNDRTTNDEKFVADLEKLQAFFDAEKIRVLYSLEALNTAVNLIGSPKNPLILQFAGRRHLEIVNLHKEFHTPENFDSGLLFMDIVHFSDAGHEVAARFFAKQPSLLKLLR